MPASQLNIARYVIYLAPTLAPQSVLAHLSAIRMLHVMSGCVSDILVDPLTEADVVDNYIDAQPYVQSTKPAATY